MIISIDANDLRAVREAEEERERLLYERRKKGNYEVNDFMLVRTTDHLGSERVIKPLFHIPFIVKNNNIVRYAVQDILDEEEPIDFYREEEKYEARSNMIRETYLPYSSQYRSTVHFTINGLVSSHAKGNFDNREFIIIDPLSYHLNKSDIRSFRMEDTYMYGDVSLSPSAVIMVKKDMFDELILEYPELKQYNIVLYSGDSKTAVEMYLTSIGIISEKIGEHGAEEHECSSQIYQFRDSLKEAYGIDSEPHWLSKEYKSDDENSLIIWDYYNHLFYTFLLGKLGVIEPEYSVRLADLMDMRKEDENKTYIKQIIKKIGLEEFKKIVDEFNINILNSIANGTFKNNEEIVNSLKNNQKV